MPNYSDPSLRHRLVKAGVMLDVFNQLVFEIGECTGLSPKTVLERINYMNDCHGAEKFTIEEFQLFDTTEG